MAEKQLTNPSGAFGYTTLTTTGYRTEIPMPTSAAISGVKVVSIGTTGTVATATTSVAPSLCVGISTGSAASGGLVPVVTYGIIENVPADGTIAAGAVLKRSGTTAGSVIDATSSAAPGEVLGVAVTAASGGLVTVLVGHRG